MPILTTAAINNSVASKAAQKATESLFQLATGPVAFWWKQRKNNSIASELGKRIRTFDRVKTLLHTDKAVPLSSIYFPSTIDFGDGREHRINSISEFPPDHNYIVEGTVGQGKSFFLRHLCVNQLRQQGLEIPIFLELRYLKAGESFRDFLYSAFRAHGFHIDDTFFKFYATSGRFILMLDAFDEVPESELTATIRAISELADTYPALRLFVTSRPDSPLHSSAYFRVVKVSPLRPADHQRFLECLLGDKASAKRMADAIASSPVQEVLTTPLLMTLLALVFNADLAIPTNEAEFYQRLFDILLYRHDRFKPGFQRARYTKLGEREIRELFEALCFFTRQARLGVLTVDQFFMHLEKAKLHTAKNVDSNRYKDEIVKVACLLQEEGATLQFIHKSVQEFYAAAFILHSPERSAEMFYQAVCEKGWPSWRQELRFLSITDDYRFSKFFLLPQYLRLISAARIIRTAQGDLRATTDTVMPTIRGVSLRFSRNKADYGWDTPNAINLGSSGTGLESFYSWAEIREEAVVEIVRLLRNDETIGRKAAAFAAAEHPRAFTDAVVPLSKIVVECKLMASATRIIDMSLCGIADAWRNAESVVSANDARTDIFQTL